MSGRFIWFVFFPPFFPPSTEDWYPVDDVAGLVCKESLGLWKPAWASVPFGDILEYTRCSLEKYLIDNVRI